MSEEFRVGDWLAEGFEGIKSKVQMPHVDLMPEEFGEHIRASRKEFLTRRSRGWIRRGRRARRQRSRSSDRTPFHLRYVKTHGQEAEPCVLMSGSALTRPLASEPCAVSLEPLFPAEEE
jgi:hypothetical protein